MKRLSAALVLLCSVIVLAFAFAAFDYYTITRAHWHLLPWFSAYRAFFGNVLSWLSPLSFALAENLYYLLGDWFGWPAEWGTGWYSGQWWNPDGHWRFIWGGGVYYPMWDWYAQHALRACLWAGALVVLRAGIGRGYHRVRMIPESGRRN